MSVSAKIEAIQNLHATHNIISTLEQSKASIEQLVDEMPDALFVFDSTGMILKANLEGCRLLKVEPEYYLGTNLAKVFDDECYNILSSKIQMIAKQPTRYERAHEFELQAMMTREELQPYHWALRPLVPLSFDKVPLIVLYGRNLSEIRSFERELSQIYSNIPIGIISIGEKGRVEANYSRYCEYLLQHSHFDGIDNGFAGISIVDLLFEPAFPTLNAAEIEACKLMHRVVGDSEYWFESIKSQFPRLLRRRIGDSELWLKVDYHAVTQEGKVHKILLIIENRTDLIHEREERSIWIKRNESGVRRILEIQNAESSLLESFCTDLESLIYRLDQAVEARDFVYFKEGIQGIKLAADRAGFLTLREIADILEVRISGDTGKEQFSNPDFLAKEYAPIRVESVELVRIFYTLSTASIGEYESRTKIDPTVYRNLKREIALAIESIDQKTEGSTRNILERLYQQVLRLNYVRLSTMEPYFADLVKTKSSHEKKIVKLNFAWESVVIPAELAKPIRDVFTFILERAISKGIEMPDHRQKLGKPDHGQLKICAESNENEVIFTLMDDGCGISAIKIREYLRKKPMYSNLILESMNDEQVFEKIFASNLLDIADTESTQITNFNGVRMFFSQVKAYDIRTSSKLGFHTTLQFKISFKS